VFERGFSQVEANLGELREILAGEACETAKSKFIRVGKNHTDHIIFTCKININEPIGCLDHYKTFLLRDPETNFSIGIGKVLKLKPSQRDPA